MTDPIKRTETTHIDEVSRTSTSTVQWLLEMANKAGTHPISHNNKLTFMIGGQEAFDDIARHIAAARESIDICCWGFDPGMELVRGGGTWPRGETYGDLLIAAGRRGVQVRLLLWYDALAVNTKNPRNLPGFTHDIDYNRLNVANVKNPIDARASLAQVHENVVNRKSIFVAAEIPFVARRNYCMDWYIAAVSGNLKNIEIRQRGGNADAIAKSLGSETNQPSFGSEKAGMVHVGTHHQKPILIDFAHDGGRAAMAYIMGLNSLSEYWDTTEHMVDDPLREGERMLGSAASPDFTTLRPLRDYACRIDGGRALVAVHDNFVTAWARAAPQKIRGTSSGNVAGLGETPDACLRKAEPGDCTVQIVRTQPEEGDKTIKDAYFMATDQAALAMGYIYVENQYFQYAEWAQRLINTRKTVMQKWKAACASSGKGARDMPIMHVFIVIPVPELAGMIPRTYDALATLGQEDGMKGQKEMIRKYTEQGPATVFTGFGQQATIASTLPDVVQDANRIDKPSEKLLETQYGLKVCTVMLNACDVYRGKWRYREIYIHSKLMMIDDIFLTLGSANLNQRSMAVDSEINLSTVAPDKVGELRRRVWGQLSGGDERARGGAGSRAEMELAFSQWKYLAAGNSAKKQASLPMSGLLLQLEDKRSSTIRLG